LGSGVYLGLSDFDWPFFPEISQHFLGYAPRSRAGVLSGSGSGFLLEALPDDADGITQTS
jgi:hypothetical protein